jgi:phage baseplate assembly protein W
MSFDLTLTNNDLSVNADGKIATVTDTPKLRQDILKIILTPLGSMKRHLWYGCAINDSIIGQKLPDSIILSKISSSISQSISRLKTLQISQSSQQKVSLAELIDIFGGVTAERDVSDRRLIKIVVAIVSKRLTKIEEFFTIIS